MNLIIPTHQKQQTFFQFQANHFLRNTGKEIHLTLQFRNQFFLILILAEYLLSKPIYNSFEQTFLSFIWLRCIFQSSHHKIIAQCTAFIHTNLFYRTYQADARVIRIGIWFRMISIIYRTV